MSVWMQKLSKYKKDYSWNPSTWFVKVFKKYCGWLSDRVWWNYICYECCINHNDKYYTNKFVKKLP